MIESISIKNCATYNQFGTDIVELKKVNFIYGANGSGKTTLSKLIANPREIEYSDCVIKWLHDIEISTLVYNKEFRDKNFGKDSIAGVFTLGEATQEDIITIQKKQEELGIIKSDGIQKKDTLDNQVTKLKEVQEKFREDCWKKVYKKYENNFKEAFIGVMQKETFKNKLLSIFDLNTPIVLIYDELNIKAHTIFGKAPESLVQLYNIDFDEIYSLESNEIWKRKIIGKSDVNIASLIQELNLNDWVNHGKDYIRDDGICPFCQEKTITDDFNKQLEDYFDKTFTDSIEILKKINQHYNTLLENLINVLNQIEISQKGNSNTKLDVDKFSEYLKTLQAQYISNKEQLSNKIKEPSRSIELISTKEQLENIHKLINDANEEIKNHNNIVNNYKSEKEELTKNIWIYIVDEYKEDIEKYKKEITGLKQGIESLKKEHLVKQGEWSGLNIEIKDLTKNVTSIQPTVDEINKLLLYYGFSNFEIAPSQDDEHKYQIKREDGALAELTLSEGEITFITFLYFLQLSKGAIDKEKISEDRILVIDDPISSLDSNILFVVSTLIKQIIAEIKEDKGNIKQLILLTHNVYFHKEVTFINSRNNGCKNTDYWIVRKCNKVSSFQSYGMKNPIQTSYQLLWQELKDKDKSSNITIQNTMRRIIENYFKILGNYRDDSIIEKFATQEEQIICKSLISWINDGSHSITDDLYIEIQDDLIDKYLGVFKNIFIHTNHEGHYNMMMEIDEDDK